MARLLDHFSPLISDVLELAERMSSAEKPLDGAASIRSRLVDGLHEAQAQARGAGTPERDLQQATFGVVAWIDEVMLGYPEWGTAVANLQGELLGTQIARETFFQHLEQIDDDQDEVREVYYVLLCLGFQGYYGELSEGRKELERLKDLHGRRLQMAPASASALIEERLTAQPYGVRPPPPLPEPKPEPRRRRRWFLYIVPLLVLVLLLGFLLWPWWLERRIIADIDRLECADVAVTIGYDRIVEIEGYVASDADREGLTTGLNQRFGVAGVDGNVEVHPWPFCEALEVVSPYDRTNGLTLGITAAGDVLKDGEPLILTIDAPDFPAFLYIDYYQQNGDVVHVLHSPAGSPPLQAGESLQIDTGFEGAEPYGEELLTIIASPEPLFPEALEGVQDAKDYLADLRQRLNERQGGDTIAASTRFIQTEP